MKGVSVVLLLGVFAGWTASQYLNHRPFPTYSLENMPDTEFSCREKVLGGYYADPDTDCQMFHICVKVAGIGVQDFRFLCPNGTAFDQDHQICADWEDVDCDAATLYYSSDNFDLYRIGSGFESKAVKYGEDEETFALQRAETGDARLNREHQTQRVNQQKESTVRYNNNDREIFKGSSSSNFFNNRNGGKETEYEEENDGPVNVNQNNDREQKRKILRKQNRRPVNQQQEERTQRPTRPTGFVNNFAGSYAPTTAKPFSSEAPRRFANRQKTQQTETTTTPFRQTQQYNTLNRQTTTQKPTKETENYPSNFPKKQTFPPTTNTQYETTKLKQTETTTQFTYPTTKPLQFKNTDTFPTTFAPRTNAAYTQIAQQTALYTNKKHTNNPPTTFDNTTPKTSPAYTQYTPTVPKITTPYQQPTTPVNSRSNSRYDETQYNYDNREDELINTAHSTNIANSKNELLTKNKVSTTQKPYYESPRPFSVASSSPVTPKSSSTTQQQNSSTKQQQQTVSNNKTTKKEKNVSYDYAYYDTNVGSEPEYDINTELEKTPKKKQ